MVLPFHKRKVVNRFHKPAFSLELLGTKVKAPDPFHKYYFLSILCGPEYGYHNIQLGRGHKQTLRFDKTNDVLKI